MSKVEVNPWRVRSDESRLFFTEPSLTKQSFKDECDINQIMSRFRNTGLLDHVSRHEGRYGDFLGSVDYHAALNQVIAADEMFMSLPADLRAEFKNDPGLFLDFVQKPENEVRMAELGLLKPDVAAVVLRKRDAVLAAGTAVAAAKPAPDQLPT